jgi:hypothetical protein
MKDLVVCDPIKYMEIRINILQGKCTEKKTGKIGKMQPLLKETAHKCGRLKTSFRNNVRKIADKVVLISSGKSKSDSFTDYFMSGFDFARSIPLTTTVSYHKFVNSPNVVFFYTDESNAKLTDLIKKYELRLVELEKLLQVEIVMTS